MRQPVILKSYVIKFFREIAVERYGFDTGQELYEQHKALCLDLARQYPSLSKQEQKHYFEQILPFIAVYQIMQEHDSSQAGSVLQTILERRSAQALGILQKLMKVPGLYKKVPQIGNLLMEKSFNEASGFRYGQRFCDAHHWKTDIVQCPYFNACRKFGCPEIANYFCDSDDLIYGALHEKVLWKRRKTLGRGDEVCDFHVEIT